MSGKASIAGMTAGDGILTVLAGPCMAESRELCLETAAFLKDLCASLGVHYVFKASFDKANRSSGTSVRGPGLKRGLEILAAVKERFGVPVVTDVHESCQAAEVAKVADVLQIPAFLCRQTDLLEACAATGRCVNVKKGQFMAPEDMKGAVGKLRNAGCADILLTERGASFGYHNLVVDMRSFPVMSALGVPVIFDATHSVQLPGGLGNASGGQREFIRPLARAAAGAGIDGIFMEVHPDPEHALSDGPNSLNFKDAETVLKEVKEIYGIACKYR
jgi:2-dehydro-3-deoxyphosphooctonate aldolase (KDO 8-P synthase)